MKLYENEEFESFFDDVNLENTEFIECAFKNIDFSTISFRGAVFIDCSFEYSNCSNINLLNTTFKHTKFTGCKLIGVNWSSCKALRGLHFAQCLLDYCVFQDTILENTIFEECSLCESDFSNAKLKGASFQKSNLLMCSFVKSDLSHCDLRYAQNYSIDARFTNIEKSKFSLPEALSLLNTFNISVED